MLNVKWDTKNMLKNSLKTQRSRFVGINLVNFQIKIVFSSDKVETLTAVSPSGTFLN